MTDNFIAGTFFGMVWLLVTMIAKQTYGEPGSWIAAIGMGIIFIILRGRLRNKSINTRTANKSKDFLEG